MAAAVTELETTLATLENMLEDDRQVRCVLGAVRVVYDG
jgi:hypothetical protein